VGGGAVVGEEEGDGHRREAIQKMITERTCHNIPNRTGPSHVEGAQSHPRGGRERSPIMFVIFIQIYFEP
jgi:hypothetical protein